VAHETVTELITEVIGRVQDPSFTSTRILRYLNQGMKEISGHPDILLPELSTSDTVEAGTTNPYVALPDDYQKKLYYCHSITLNRRVKIFNSYPQLLRHVSTQDQAGSVWGVAVRGSYLYYQRIPSSAETLQLHYYKKPTALESDSSPTEIPEHLCRDLLVNFVCREIFKIKSMSNPEFLKAKEEYERYFDQAMSDLKRFLGPEECLAAELEDETEFDSYL